MEKDLLKASERGDLETVRKLSSHIRNIRDNIRGEGPLHIAARYNIFTIHNAYSELLVSRSAWDISAASQARYYNLRRARHFSRSSAVSFTTRRRLSDCWILGLQT